VEVLVRCLTSKPRVLRRWFKFYTLAFAACLALEGAGSLWAQDDPHPVKWTLAVKNQSLKPGERFTAEAVATIASGWHVYSITQPRGGPIATAIIVPENPSFVLVAPITGPQPEKNFDPNFQMETEMYTDSARFKLPLLVKPKAPARSQLQVGILFQTCNDHLCLPPTRLQLSASVRVIAGSVKGSSASLSAPASPGKTSVPSAQEAGTQPSSTGNTKASASSGELPPTTPNNATQPSSNKPFVLNAGPGGIKQQNLGSFIWLAMVMGALSLLTPCVFPMIPITVSYFTNHAGANRRTAIATALIYGIGIILTFTALGMLLALVFGAGGVNQLAANPWINLLITAIFLGFAFSLFGAYFIQVPSGLMGRLDAITRSKDGSGALGALLMGFTFTLTSFTCTAPFVGTLLVMTAQGNWRWPLAGMFAFSTVFAIPFFLLALAPQLLSRLPKAGGWMVEVKVVMGFLEIAAAMKFLSNADLIWGWGMFTRQVVLAVWVGIGVLSVLYVLGFFRMENETAVKSVGAARVTVAIVFLSTTIWLVPGLFGRQLGELESFLPPELGAATLNSTSTGTAQKQPEWILNNYEGALEAAKQQNKLVFIDFTGYTCTNCRWMEANMFPRPEVASEMDKFVRARLYTDGDGELYERQQKMQQGKFGTVALPLYAILRSDGTTVATFPGLTRNTSEFLAFLQKAETH
jgi:thiol:disulfide interchange protein DsbD